VHTGVTKCPVDTLLARGRIHGPVDISDTDVDTGPSWLQQCRRGRPPVQKLVATIQFAKGKLVIESLIRPLFVEIISRACEACIPDYH